jgi:hypothetical protein
VVRIDGIGAWAYGCAATDNLELRAVALLDQAEVLGGERGAAAATEALRLADRKGVVPLATRARRRLAGLPAPEATTS